MNVTDIANDLAEHLKQSQAWVTKVLEQHVPALLAEGERLPSSPIVQILEKVMLPPEAEQAIAEFIAKFAASYGQKAVPAAPAAGDTGQITEVGEPSPGPAVPVAS